MKINKNFISFKKKHKNKKNQIIFYKAVCKKKIIENIINNFLIKKNSFIFESVEKRRIKGTLYYNWKLILIKFGNLIKKKSILLKIIKKK